ncbi:hypothetical protein HOH87_03565 [bacterium]|jgi:polysaccharide biosynthesis protein PelA|nr:hypothetical protein [bacterium]
MIPPLCRGIFRLGMGLIFILIIWAPHSVASPFNRQVLGIYSSEKNEASITYNELREIIEMPLNHLGLQLSYHDLADGLPSASEMKKYRAVIIWTKTNYSTHAMAFWPWLDQQLTAGRRVVLIDELGPVVGPNATFVPLKTINAVLSHMGLSYYVGGDVFSPDIEVVYKNSEMVEFERKIGHELRELPSVQSIRPNNKVYLSLQQGSTKRLSDPVVITPQGGVVLGDTLRYMDPYTYIKQWRINPFLFFSKALGVEHSPRPDPTTVNGRRVFFSHVDGDGLINPSSSYPGKSSGEALYDNVYSQYTQLPLTLSVITSELDPVFDSEGQAASLAKKLFALSHVEAASHTYSHPLVWDDRLAKEGTILEYQNTVNRPHYTNHALLPNRIPGYVYNPKSEIEESIQTINDTFLPKGKVCRLLLWSGNCLPNEAAITMASQNGILNMNGGDTQFDPKRPSYTGVSPMYRQVGNSYQVHSGNANENIYTDLWSSPLGGFQSVIRTFKNTESPRRVSPVNVYYHHYSGEYLSSVNAVKKAYDWAIEQPLFPMYASQYSRLVLGVIHTKIESEGPLTWTIRNSGALKTVRFDNTTYNVDMTRSIGIIGYTHYQSALYVHLSEADTHRITLTHSPNSRHYLSDANASVTDWDPAHLPLTYRTHGWGPLQYRWNNLSPSTEYQIIFSPSIGKAMHQTLRSSAKGTLTFSIPTHGKSTGTIQIKESN